MQNNCGGNVSVHCYLRKVEFSPVPRNTSKLLGADCMVKSKREELVAMFVSTTHSHPTCPIGFCDNGMFGGMDLAI